MRVVDYVIDQVYRAGAKHVFTITGGGAMFLNDAVAAHPWITPVCNRGTEAVYRGSSWSCMD
jgi:acetolactate synthase-1/2/3 large subunit